MAEKGGAGTVALGCKVMQAAEGEAVGSESAEEARRAMMNIQLPKSHALFGRGGIIPYVMYGRAGGVLQENIKNSWVYLTSGRVRFGLGED